MSENTQQKERIAKALSNRGIEPTEEAINEIVAKGGTTVAINDYIQNQKSQQPVPQEVVT